MQNVCIILRYICIARASAGALAPAAGHAPARTSNHQLLAGAFAPRLQHVSLSGKYKDSAWLPAFADTHASDRKIYLSVIIHVSISDSEQDQFNDKRCKIKPMANKLFFMASVKPINAK